jgi:malate synthase
MGSSIEIIGKTRPEYSAILTQEALAFIIYLHRTFNARRLDLLHERVLVQRAIDNGAMPTFPIETESIRKDLTWKGAAPAPGLVDRRVEITGPVERKMVINALNCGATQFMADFEGTNCIKT